MIICFFCLHRRSGHFTYPIICDLSVEIYEDEQFREIPFTWLFCVRQLYAWNAYLKCIQTKSYFGEVQSGRWRVIFDAITTKICEHTQTLVIHCLPICLLVATNNCWVDFHEVWYYGVLLKLVDTFQFGEKSDNCNRHYMRIYMCFCAHLRCSFRDHCGLPH